MARRKKSDEIRSTDGRKNNKRMPRKVDLGGPVTSKPARMNDAKKAQVTSFAVNAIKKIYGDEQGAMEKLAELSQDSFNHLKLLLEYAYGKAGDNVTDGPKRAAKAPVINFINNEAPKEEKYIDIEAEEEDEDAEDTTPQ
jgi:hypothetical protein